MAEMFKDLDPETMVRSPGVTYQDLLDQDTHEVPPVLRLQSPKDVGFDDFSKERYISRDYHKKEVKNLFCCIFTCSFIDKLYIIDSRFMSRSIRVVFFLINFAANTNV